MKISSYICWNNLKTKTLLFNVVIILMGISLGLLSTLELVPVIFVTVCCVFFFIILAHPFLGIVIFIILHSFTLPIKTLLAFFLSSGESFFIILTNAKWIILAILFLSAIIRILTIRKKSLYLTLLDFNIIALLLVGGLYFLISLTTTNNINIAILGFKSIFFFLILFLVVKNLKISEREAKIIINLILVLGLLVAAFAIFETLSPGYSLYKWLGQPIPYIVEMGNMPRAGSYFATPLDTGFVLVIIILIFVSFLVSLNSLNLKLIIGTLCIFPCIVGLFLTFTRSAWVALLIGLLFLLFQSKHIKQIKYCIVILIAIFAVFIVIPPITEYIYKTINLDESSVLKHIERVQSGWECFIENPLGLGIGKAGTVSVRFSEVSTITPKITENWYLQMGIEMGLLGLFLSITLVPSFYITGIKKLRFYDDSFFRSLLLGLIASFLGLSIAGLFLHVWLSEITASYFWILSGIAFSGKNKVPLNM